MEKCKHCGNAYGVGNYCAAKDRLSYCKPETDAPQDAEMRAREIVLEWADQYGLNTSIAPESVTLIRLIAAALRAERARALEEAAKECKCRGAIKRILSLQRVPMGLDEKAQELLRSGLGCEHPKPRHVEVVASVLHAEREQATEEAMRILIRYGLLPEKDLSAAIAAAIQVAKDLGYVSGQEQTLARVEQKLQARKEVYQDNEEHKKGGVVHACILDVRTLKGTS